MHTGSLYRLHIIMSSVAKSAPQTLSLVLAITPPGGGGGSGTMNATFGLVYGSIASIKNEKRELSHTSSCKSLCLIAM